jgi:ABC-type multidrug transport system fused ATPase/permease subunit
VLFAADYPFLDVFWTMIIFFCWVAWIWVLIVIISDLFRRHDTSGWVKALWVIFLIILPFLGVLIYLIANGSGMSRRQLEQTQAAQQQFDSYVQSVAATSGGGATELAKAKELLDSGAITQEEYDKLKAKVLA